MDRSRNELGTRAPLITRAVDTLVEAIEEVGATVAEGEVLEEMRMKREIGWDWYGLRRGAGTVCAHFACRRHEES